MRTKLKWYRFDIARRIRNLQGEELVSELEEIIADIKEKKLDKKYGGFALQIKELQEIIQETLAKPKKKTRQFDPFYIPASGDGRIALFGLSNVGKSTLMNEITNTEVEMGDFLHTTRIAQAGTCEYENVHIQLIDLPGFLDFKEDWFIHTQIFRVSRTCDAILMVLDLSMNIKKQYEFLLNQLEKAKIIRDGETNQRIAIVATKGDLPNTEKTYTYLKSLTTYPIYPISIKNKESLDHLKKLLFEFLEVIRIYTKPPGKKVDYTKPFVLPQGTSVIDIAKRIHSSFPEKLRYARVWGKSVDFDGQQVSKDHLLTDGDVIEMNVEMD